MRDGFRLLMVGLVLAVTTTGAPAAANRDARGPLATSRTLARTQVPVKAETCRPKWPYIVLTCVA